MNAGDGRHRAGGAEQVDAVDADAAMLGDEALDKAATSAIIAS